jgi:hypothetical protein
MSCAGSSRQTQAHLADSLARSVNQTAQLLIDEYKKELSDCVQKSQSKAEYVTCANSVNLVWTRIRLDWGHMRDVQDTWARAIEAGKQDDIDTQAAALVAIYCKLQADLPKQLTIPEFAGLVCQ